MGEDRRLLTGKWAKDDIRRAFVKGAEWWEHERSGFTMWASDVDRAETEAEKRYPGGTISVVE